MARLFYVLVCVLSPGIFGADATVLAQPNLLRDMQTNRSLLIVQLRETGVVDKVFLNQADPPTLSSLAGQPVDIIFQNQSSTTDLEVVLGGRTLAIPQMSQAAITLADLEAAADAQGLVTFQVRRRDGLLIPDAIGYVHVQPQPGLATPDTGPPVQQALSVDPQSRRPAIVYRTLGAETTPPAVLAPPPPSGNATPQQPSDVRPAPSRFVEIPLNGVGVDDWDYRNIRNPPYILLADRGIDAATLGQRFKASVAASTADPTLGPKVKAAIQKIDDEYVVAVNRYDQARKSADAAVRAAARPPEDPWVRLALLQASAITFINDSIERTFTVTVDIPTPGAITNAPSPTERDMARARFEERTGLSLGDCATGPPPTCKVVLNVPFQSPKSIPAYLLAGENADQRLDFDTWYTSINREQPAVAFSVNFFDENATPAEATAYVSLVPLSSLREAASRSAWTFSPSINYAREPLVADNASFSEEEDGQYQGDVRRHFTGAARLSLKQTLGSRADAAVELAFKGGSLGEKGYTGSVTAPMYQVNINSVPGFRLSFGRFLFAAPANAIALRESGEGFRVSIRNRLSVSHLIKREGAEGVADSGDRDHRVYLIEAHNVLGGRWRSLRGVNLLVSIGHDRAPATKRRYWTAGTDLNFSVPELPVSGTAAFFHSEREPLGEESTATDAAGNVAFTSVGYTIFRKPTNAAQPTRKVAATIRGEWGVGSVDNRLTATRDEGYLGETAAFGPDTFFLSTFAPKLRGVGPMVVGLRHKHYLGLVYQEERFTPLLIAAKILQVPNRDIASQLMRAGLRSYYFRSDISDTNDQHDAGRELFLESQIETPAGVKSSLSVSYFRPGTAIRGFFRNASLWSVVSRVTVSLGS